MRLIRCILMKYHDLEQYILYLKFQDCHNSVLHIFQMSMFMNRLSRYDIGISCAKIFLIDKSTLMSVSVNIFTCYLIWRLFSSNVKDNWNSFSGSGNSLDLRHIGFPVYIVRSRMYLRWERELYNHWQLISIFLSNDVVSYWIINVMLLDLSKQFFAVFLLI